jgi:hypothetical protein
MYRTDCMYRYCADTSKQKLHPQHKGEKKENKKCYGVPATATSGAKLVATSSNPKNTCCKSTCCYTQPAEQ